LEVPRYTNGNDQHLKGIRISGRIATTLSDLRVSIPDKIKVQHPEERRKMKKLLISVLIIAVLLASGCVSDKDATTEEPTENISQIDAATLIPREVLFGNPDKITVRLSPNGDRISYLASVDGVLNVWVGPADDPNSAKPVTNDTDRGIRTYFWAYTNEHILYLQDQAGDENWRVYSVNLENDQTTDLTPIEGVQARIQAVSQKFPEEILIGLNDRDPTLHDIYRVNITTGEKSLVMENEGFVGFTTDDDYNVRFAERLTPDGGNEISQATEDGSWELFMDIAMEDLLTTGIVGFDKTGTVLYMIDSRNRNTAAFFIMDLGTGEQTLIAEDPHADTSNIMIHPTEKNVQAVAFTYERRQWQIFDDSIAADLAYLKTVADGDVEIVSRTLDDENWMVAYVLDDGPVQYYRYDREEKSAEFLFTHRKALEGLSLAKMHPVVIKSRDGLDLVSYYTLPIGSDSDFDGRPDDPLPMVLFVHGGPWARDNWGFNAVHQWLANRDYVVLSVNFRSSTGFGKAFINAGNLEWGGKMHDDLIDAVNWTVQEGIADPDRVAIMGGSYGGYATLWGMTNTSDMFACGVDIVGPSNLITLLETIPPYWEPQIELFATRVGDHRTEEGRAFLAGRSPLTYMNQIEKPLLIGQGANDPRVKQAESDQIVQAMQDANIPVTYLMYTDEGHGFARPENRLSFYAVTDAFLAQHLGGQSEPIGDDFEGSSITVISGAEEVPGLAEALAN
jgi:dipeptidyl aminopeptidase/acylaminoacyl peptidase